MPPKPGNKKEPLKTIDWKYKPNIIHYGTDGFGHQLEGTIGLISMHIAGKINYIFKINRDYSFEHNYSKGLNNDAKKYMIHAISKLNEFFKQDLQKYDSYNKVHIHEIYKIPELPDKSTIYTIDNIYREPQDYMIQSQEFIKDIYCNNPYLPSPTFKNFKGINIIIHIRLHDTANRQFELELLYSKIKQLQKDENHKNSLITIHTNGNMQNNIINPSPYNNVKIFQKNTPVLQVLSDFIHADILIMSQSALSYIASWLTKATHIYAPCFIKDNWIRRRIRPDFKLYSDIA
tara:strand:+ start:8585 stop:9454 length:870 start_codon:yes stop_codon:yes gene_type:complete